MLRLCYAISYHNVKKISIRPVLGQYYNHMETIQFILHFKSVDWFPYNSLNPVKRVLTLETKATTVFLVKTPD